MTTPLHPQALIAALLMCPVASVHAIGQGIASIGATGGLTIPSAYVLDNGEAALSLGNYQDAKLGEHSKKQNYTLGFGVLPGVELFGRLAEYTTSINAPPGAPDANGIRDISANLKWQLPVPFAAMPKLAVGVTDLSGGAVFFKSAYAVASDELGPLRWTLGYARASSALGRPKVLDGFFGGGELMLGNTRATLLAETDGTSRHAGVRYYSEPLPWLGSAQLVGTVQRSFGATNLLGRADNASSFNVSLVMSLDASDASRNRHASVIKVKTPLPPISVTAQGDPLPELLRTLQASGLDRVHVGTLGDVLVVEYENQRYLHNEVDALGIVLGLAAEQAPAGTQRVRVISLKAGLGVLDTSVNLADFRDYLRWGDAAPVQRSLLTRVATGHELDAVQWAGGTRRPTALVNVALTPLLNHTVATEYGLFEYSLALQLRASTPLWRGAQAYVDAVQPISNSANMEPGRVFQGSRHESGVQTVALQQSFWLGERIFNSIGVGRYNYDTTGLQGESILFAPWNNDTVHLRASVNRDHNAWSTSYRWHMNPNTWLEAGFNEYTDGGRGPSVAFTRWFGDVALQMAARKDANFTFIGLQLSLPLTPRQGMGAAAVQVSGSPRFATGLRTRMADGGGNSLILQGVRPVVLSYQSEVEQLNSGRLSPDYLNTQLPRLRESFYLHARELMP